jgi:type II secretion system protein H
LQWGGSSTGRAPSGAPGPGGAGFTLVEILAVIVILGIASAIVIPQIGTRDDMRVKAAARTLIADLIYAQNLAISTGQVVYVRFDVAGNQYSMLTNPANAKRRRATRSSIRSRRRITSPRSGV